MTEIPTIDISGGLSTAIGELEMKPFGNHVCQMSTYTVIISEDEEKIVLQMHANHRSEDIEMNMSTLLEPSDAMYLGSLLQSWGRSIQKERTR